MSRAIESAAEMPKAWRAARRILAVRLDNLGDVLMTTPALAAIRHALPGSHISLLSSPGSAMLSGHLPDVDAFIPFEAPWMKAGAGCPPGPGWLESMATQLRAMAFDAAIIFTVCTQSPLPAAMLCMMAGIPLRLAHCRENPYALLSDWVPDHEVVEHGMRHEVARQLALVARVGMQTPSNRLRFAFAADDEASLKQLMAAEGLGPAADYFVVHVGASAASRRYPAALFGAAANLIAARSGALAVFTGSSAEAPLIETARCAMGTPAHSLAGRLRLGELGALLAGARVLVSNNSGPVHMAAALGTPVVDLYALTNPQHTPWEVPAVVLNEDVPCRNCLRSECPEGHHRCLSEVRPRRVADAALALMQAFPDRLQRPAHQAFSQSVEAG
ncbi:glycosyltransferase family 9 protein [Uliginosibacterium paludis]|uniref:Glycosyltransferase family 9 protein n=1 Tax=Uliginosibacterium paludis TaxID=1615952 RepID=A0ABV2CT35_9RHOO